MKHWYLWHGDKIAKKARPCVVVLGFQRSDEHPGRFVTDVVPVTHSPSDGAVEIPLAVKKRMGLDDDHSWIVTTEVNRFIWPGESVTPVSYRWQRDGHLWHWGILANGVFKRVQEAVQEHRSESRLKMTTRP